MADDGVIVYPYSTREVVNIVKHLALFPSDSVVQTLENVLAFDSFDENVRQQLARIFSAHGFPVGQSRPVSVRLTL